MRRMSEGFYVVPESVSRKHTFFGGSQDGIDLRLPGGESVLALKGRSLNPLGVFRDEVSAATEDGGYGNREAAAAAIAVAMLPTSLAAVGAGAIVAGPVGAAAAMGAVAVTALGGAGGVALKMSQARSTVPENAGSDDWDYGFDNKFAERLKKDLSLECQPESSSKGSLCHTCHRIMEGEETSAPFHRYHDFREDCNLCGLLQPAIEPYLKAESALVKRCSSTIVVSSPTVVQVPLIRLCSDILSPGKPDPKFMLSFPALPATREFRFTLLRNWLKWCDGNHNCNQTKGKPMPPRLVDLGKSLRDPPRLVSTDGMKPQKYIAVSHRWGLTSAERKQYCTTRENFDSQQEKIERIAPTFEDAIEVARAVDVRYLWIDSLCIIQYDRHDWEEQSKFMKGVYASAYCTIAATAAEDMSQTFLERTSQKTDYACIGTSSGWPIFACSDTGNFEEEVERAELNGRAWILQERILACRTIHFGAGQMYWECGAGVYCEDLTRLETSSGRKKHFRVDPEFPRLLYKSGVAPTLYFIESLLVDYSTRGISKDEDRAVAISGLQDRISVALECKGRFGVFGLFRQRNLLWRRSVQNQGRIDYGPRKVPSWSWMAYKGGIEFLNVPFGNFMSFNPLEFHLTNETVLVTPLWAFGNCRLINSGTAQCECQVVDASGKEMGSVTYDVEVSQVSEQSLCVIVGRSEDVPASKVIRRSIALGASKSADKPNGVGMPKRAVDSRYHILVVEKKRRGEYERIGVGWVRIDCIKSKVHDRVWLV